LFIDASATAKDCILMSLCGLEENGILMGMIKYCVQHLQTISGIPQQLQ